MDLRALAASLVDLGLSDGLAADPAAALRSLEDRADRDPGDRRVARGIGWLADRLAVEAQSPPVVGGVRRERLVRWDHATVTWVGTASDGAPTMVRALRPEAARDPVQRRQLARDGRALAPLIPVVTDDGVLRLPLAGLPLSPVWGDALARPLCTGLAALRGWEERGLGLPRPTEDELRTTADGAVVACLSPVVGTSAGGIAALAGALADPSDPSPLSAAVRALGTHPPDRVAEAALTVRLALAEALVGRRHGLAGGWRETWHRSREGRLRDAVQRLVEAVPAPGGRGAVGVDLDGRITVVQAGPDEVSWGPEGEAEVVFDRDQGIRPPLARRLLRARAVSPPNAALDARVGGDPALTDAICRWVAAGLKLRTVQLLLARERP